MNSFIDPIIERFRPHAMNARDYMVIFCTGVIERLDRLVDANEGDATYTVRHEYHGASAAGPAAVTIEVPATQTWILESVAARTVPAAASTLDMREQGGRLRFANDIAASGALTGLFAPLHFNGGTVLVATMAQPGEFHLTFASQRPVARRHSLSGLLTTGPDRPDFRQELETSRRHAAVFHTHDTIMGPHHTEAATGTYLNDAGS